MIEVTENDDNLAIVWKFSQVNFHNTKELLAAAERDRTEFITSLVSDVHI